MTPTATAADITFNEDGHTYFLGMERIPSVSEILRPLTESYLSGIPEGILNRKRDLGIAVHRACELIDMGLELDPETVDPDVNGYVEGYRKFLADHHPMWVAIEKIVFDPDRRFAGRLDRAGAVGDRTFVIDLKTSVKLGSSVAVQLTAYAEAAGNIDGLKTWDVAALQLMPKGDYAFVPMSRQADVWDALVTIHHFKENLK